MCVLDSFGRLRSADFHVLRIENEDAGIKKGRKLAKEAGAEELFPRGEALEKLGDLLEKAREGENSNLEQPIRRRRLLRLHQVQCHVINRHSTRGFTLARSMMCMTMYD